jgi:hypothetical protein
MNSYIGSLRQDHNLSRRHGTFNPAFVAADQKVRLPFIACRPELRTALSSCTQMYTFVFNILLRHRSVDLHCVCFRSQSAVRLRSRVRAFGRSGINLIVGLLVRTLLLSPSKTDTSCITLAATSFSLLRHAVIIIAVRSCVREIIMYPNKQSDMVSNRVSNQYPVRDGNRKSN